MAVVHFLPADRHVEVAAGTLIHEAAIRAGLLDFELPCGAQGACGLCLVEIVSSEDRSPLRMVPACQTKVREDLTVRLPERQDLAMQVVGDSHFLTGEDVLPDPACLSPLFRFLPLTVPPASIEEHYSDWLRLTRALHQAGLPGPVSTGTDVLRHLAAALRQEDGRVVVGVQEAEGGVRIQDILPGHDIPPALGLAIDIGTTTIAAQLVDLADGRILGTATTYNQQIRRGADIISRIEYARTVERQQEMRNLVLETINGLIGELAGEDSRTHIRAAFVAGNTTMIHLLLALPPGHIREAPYVPTVNPIPALTAGEVGLTIPPGALVRCAPGVGSYLGGDITAGLLTTEFTQNRDDVYLFMDIGTNGEIVVGNADWMVGCACSAGPAFEGSGIKCGMRASPGAIEQLAIGADLRTVSYQVVGGGRPAGICGSGLICLLGELFLRGLIDPAGHFHPDRETDRLVTTANGHGFVVERAGQTATGQDLVVTEADLENLIRTKGAIYAACALILRKVGLTWEAIARVYIAGGFGRFLNVSDAVVIGMLPDVPQTRCRYIGNSALTGASIALLSRRHRELVTAFASRMTYLDLGSDPHYMDSYVQATFLPHTDLGQFPTVAQKMAELPNGSGKQNRR
jgi:uncharacterized 2Fe-2S/4Fe-4S cluster protein (DUF4445 family)